MTIKNIRFASPIDNYHHCEIQKISLVAMMAICPDLVISQVEEKKLGMKKTQKLCDFLLEKNIVFVNPTMTNSLKIFHKKICNKLLKYNHKKFYESNFWTPHSTIALNV